MGDLNEAAIEKLKADNSGHELRLVKCPDESELVVKSPDKVTYNLFMSDATNSKKEAAVSMEAYVMRCVVYPDKQVASALFTKYPAMPGQMAGLLNEMAGHVEELDSKKL